MDKSWMKKNRMTNEYFKGIDEFMEFASHNVSQDGKILCPCVKCVNSYFWSLDVVRAHLESHGISPGYDCWYYHGESMSAATCNRTNDNHPEETGHQYGGMHDMLHDIFPRHTHRMNECGDEGNFSEPFAQSPNMQQPSSNTPNKDARKFYTLLEDADQPLYEGCKNFSKLSGLVHLYHLKCLNGWSNHSFTLLLQLLADMLPSGSKLPKDYYDAKKIIKDLGFGYVKIHACPKDCMLFWKEHENDEVCRCGASRWVTTEKGLENNTISSKKKKKPAKVLRWFPLTPELQKLFMSSKTASSMKWHDEGRKKDDDIMRHPADSVAWKTFDSRYPDFSSDPRNVRLGLASDGFNPFGDMSTSYSTWPVLVFPYNLPPWMCMKRSSIMLSLLIPGPTSPGNDIDVYLQPLIEELKQLWIGVETYDASSQKNFNMRAALMWTINDFPAYGDLSGWGTKGALACPSCNYSTDSQWLKHGGKYCYMGHRRFLAEDHVFREDRGFDGNEEREPAPVMLSGSEILMHTEGLDFTFGKTEANDKRKRKRQANEEVQPWKKRSIFFNLPYWENHILRHMLDVMHIEKNVIDNVYGTLLDIDGKTKDNKKARLDCRDMGVRPELHPEANGDLPRACFSMLREEKDKFLKVLKSVKFPDGYASNLSRCIQLRQRKIINMKSHDGHILMQQLLPIALRGLLTGEVTLSLMEISSFFRELCSKSLRVDELELVESQIALTLCKLERLLPPSFFTVMVHLVVHLAAEAKIAGPVRYRWMFFIERYLQKLKSYVRNKARPEGSIAEGYIAEACLTLCSRYLESFPTIFNRPTRNVEDATGAIVNIELDHKSWVQAHRYVLFHTDEIDQYRAEHKDHIKRQSRHKRRLTDEAIHKIHMEQFCEWFRNYVVVMDDTRKQQLPDKVKSLSRGPNTEARRFKRYVSNGRKFRVESDEASKKTQNSGVCVPIAGGPTYYGVLTDIIELNYFDDLRYVLLKCKWADVKTGRGHKVDEYGFNLVNFTRLIHTGERLNDEPYILAWQASQVYYVEDIRCKDWHVVVKTIPRDVFDEDNGESSDDDTDT